MLIKIQTLGYMIYKCKTGLAYPKAPNAHGSGVTLAVI